MDYPILAIVVGFVAAPLWLLVLSVFDTYRQLPEPEVVTCPGLSTCAAVELTVDDTGQRHVVGCSRWPLCYPCREKCIV
jgi:hypothetical protein